MSTEHRIPVFSVVTRSLATALRSHVDAGASGLQQATIEVVVMVNGTPAQPGRDRTAVVCC